MIHMTLRLLVFAVAGMSTYIVADMLNRDDRLPVQEWQKVDVVNSPIRAGQPIKVRIWRHKVRDDCPVASARQAIDEDGRTWDLPGAVWQGGVADDRYLDYQYHTPDDLPPGAYTLRVHLTYTCPEFVWSTQQPDARFRVVE